MTRPAPHFLVANDRTAFDAIVMDYLTDLAQKGDKIIHNREEWMLDGDYDIATSTKAGIKREFDRFKCKVRIYELGDTYYVYCAPKEDPKGITRLYEAAKPPAHTRPYKPRTPRVDHFMVAIPDDL